MGAKTSLLIYADSDARRALAAQPQLNREATRQLATRLFGEKVEPLGDADLSCTWPPGGEVHIACFPGVSIVAAKEFAVDYPSKLPQRFIEAGGTGMIFLHAMHGAVDWFAFAQWSNAKLIRSLSLSPDSGILEDIGERLPFERPYWAGEHPVAAEDDSYPFAFHPLELAEAALLAILGFQLEGSVDPAQLNPQSVPLVRYKRPRPWWAFWR